MVSMLKSVLFFHELGPGFSLGHEFVGVFMQ